MNKSIGLLNSTASWEFKRKKSVLKINNSEILELKTGKKKRATFKWEDKVYTIRNRGFWNPVTEVAEEDKSILILKRFFRTNKAFIEFENGEKYMCKTQNPVFLKLSIRSMNRKEVVVYKLISKFKATIKLNSDNPDISERDLIFLIVLGGFIFRGILKENKFADIKSVLFSSIAAVNEIPVAQSN